MEKTVRSIAVLLMIFTLFTGCQALTGETLGRNIDDTTITTWVKSSLVAEKATNLTRVQVTTNNGVVHLTGTVQTVEWKEKAEQIARGVDGVKDVVNNIQIQK